MGKKSMIIEEKTISSERIYEGRILNLRKDLVQVKDGKTSYREIVEHNGGVALAAITPEGKMVLVKQYRKAAEKAVLEVPAGKIEKGEDHRLTAERELKEETGYTAGKISFITSFYSSIGYSTEVIYLYLATELTPGETEFDENEAIDILEYDLAALKNMVLHNEIEDAKTIAAILLAESITAKGTIQ
jgi:ADP-ribose pyrophosphatase